MGFTVWPGKGQPLDRLPSNLDTIRHHASPSEIVAITLQLSASEFLTESANRPIIDVRAPVEFTEGHIPGAVNIPLLDDSQREIVGKLYREQGRAAATQRGLQFVRQRLPHLKQQVETITRDHATGPDDLLVHCWRGGMRSQSFAWLLEQFGHPTRVLEGGYKAYRRHVLNGFQKPLQLVVLSGLTGAGKTHQLKCLRDLGEQVIDLEGLANHRGSAFGGIGLPPQPTVQQFQNEMAQLIDSFDSRRRIWLEDESQKIGRVVIDDRFVEQIRQAPAIFIDVSQTVRAQNLALEYGPLSVDALRLSTQKIGRRFGSENVDKAIAALDRGDLQACATVLLEYYDKTYRVSQARQNRPQSYHLATESPLASTFTSELIRAADEKRWLHPTS